MLKVGIIGSVSSIASHLQVFKNAKDIRVIGKSSVGMMEQSDGKYLSIPEFSRRDLVEASDLLVIDDSRLLHPDLLKSAVKSSRHLYFADYPLLSTEACHEMVKLSSEAQTMVYVRNPFLDKPLTSWIAQYRKEPLYLSMFESMSELPDKREFLTRYLFFAMAVFNAIPQKIRVSGIRQNETGFFFANVRLDYATYSSFNLELLIQPKATSTLKAAMPGKFLTGDLISGKAEMNQREFSPGPAAPDSLLSFLESAVSGNFHNRHNLHTYHAALLTLQDVMGKIELYTPWHSQ